MRLGKILSNVREFVETRKYPIIMWGATLALVAATAILFECRYQQNISKNPSFYATSREVNTFKFYRGTPEGDNLFDGYPDWVGMEMTRNCPTLSPDRIIDYCQWYKQECGSWKKWDDATCRAYSERVWKRFIEAKQAPFRG